MTSRRLRLTAGWALLVICAAHLALFTVLSRDVAAGWLLGDLRDGTATPASEALFWALPGGFVLPMVVLAALIMALTRRDVAIPAFVGIGLSIWTLINLVIMPASGFVAVVVPCALLVAASVLDRRAALTSDALTSDVSAAPVSRPAAG